jgi:hypothetical protein
MNSQRPAVSGVAASRGADALKYVKHDAGETVFIEIDLLIIRDLPDVAVNRYYTPSYIDEGQSASPHI